MGCWIELILRIVPIVTAVATVIVAIYVAKISKQQWKTNQEKLRFDLYQRRFEVYLRVLDFHMAFLQWPDPLKLDGLRVPFVKAWCESKFLFPKESGVYDSLQNYNERTGRVTGSRMTPSDHLSPEMRAQLTEDEIWIKDYIDILDGKISPYLNFHSI